MSELYLDEVAFLQGFNSRDRHTVNKLHGLIHKKYYWFAYDFLKDKAQAEDAITDAFLAILKREEEFISMINIYKWLYRRVRWKCLDVLKQRAIYGNIDDLTEIPDEDTTIDGRLVKAEVYDAIYREIERFPDRDKQIIKLYFFEDITTQEIAEQLGMNVKTVHNTRKLLLKIIRNELIRKSLTVLILCIMLPVK